MSLQIQVDRFFYVANEMKLMLIICNQIYQSSPASQISLKTLTVASRFVIFCSTYPHIIKLARQLHTFQISNSVRRFLNVIIYIHIFLFAPWVQRRTPFWFLLDYYLQLREATSEWRLTKLTVAPHLLLQPCWNSSIFQPSKAQVKVYLNVTFDF